MKLNVSRFFNANFIWRMVALLLGCILFTSHFASGLFAKYSSGVSGSDQARVANFSYSAKVSDVSALSFTNTDFWGGAGDSEENKVAMNALRSLTFNVNNFKMVDDREFLSEVGMRYTLAFITPRNFARKLAFQLFDAADQPLLPQIVILELLNVANDGEFNTAHSIDYNAALSVGLDMKFKVKRTPVNDMVDAYGETLEAYTLTANTEKLGNVVIKIEPEIRPLAQALQFRLWDTSKITASGNPSTVETEGGILRPPLGVEYESQVTCYRISISLEKIFLFEAANKQTHKYNVRFAPTEQLDDNYLGGAFYVGDELATELYQGQQLKLRTNHETITDKLKGSNEVIKTYSRVVQGKFTSYTDDDEPIINETVVLEKEHTVEISNPDRQISATNISAGDDGGVIFLTKDLETTIEEDAQYKIEHQRSNSGQSGRFNYTASSKKTQAGDILHREMVTEDITAVTISNDNKTVTLDIDETTKAEHLIPYTDEVSFTFSSNNISRSIINLFVKNAEGNWDKKNTANITNGEELTFTLGGTYIEPYTDKERKIIRTIQRGTLEQDITLKKVQRLINPEDITPTSYTESNKFYLFEDEKQKFFVSQSYSKNYPLRVNVVFEQLA